jgi:DNA-binding response OmpR family regulator
MPDYTILLVDYDPDSATRLSRPLVRGGYRVEIATDGLAGISRFHELAPDLTLIEAMIPKKHGFEVCQELKSTAHGQNTDVWILTSVYKGRKYRTQAYHHYKCDQYLEKPISEEELMASVDGYFAERARLAEAVESNALEPSVTDFDLERKRTVPDDSPAPRPQQILASSNGPIGGGPQAAAVPEMHFSEPDAEALRSEIPEELTEPSVVQTPDAPRRGRLFLWIALALLVALGGFLAVTVLL